MKQTTFFKSRSGSASPRRAAGRFQKKSGRLPAKATAGHFDKKANLAAAAHARETAAVQRLDQLNELAQQFRVYFVEQPPAAWLATDLPCNGIAVYRSDTDYHLVIRTDAFEHDPAYLTEWSLSEQPTLAQPLQLMLVTAANHSIAQWTRTLYQRFDLAEHLGYPLPKNRYTEQFVFATLYQLNRWSHLDRFGHHALADHIPQLVFDDWDEARQASAEAAIAAWHALDPPLACWSAADWDIDDWQVALFVLQQLSPCAITQLDWTALSLPKEAKQGCLLVDNCELLLHANPSIAQFLCEPPLEQQVDHWLDQLARSKKAAKRFADRTLCDETTTQLKASWQAVADHLADQPQRVALYEDLEIGLTALNNDDPPTQLAKAIKKALKISRSHLDQLPIDALSLHCYDTLHLVTATAYLTVLDRAQRLAQPLSEKRQQSVLSAIEDSVAEIKRNRHLHPYADLLTAWLNSHQADSQTAYTTLTLACDHFHDETTLPTLAAWPLALRQMLQAAFVPQAFRGKQIRFAAQLGEGSAHLDALDDLLADPALSDWQAMHLQADLLCSDGQWHAAIPYYEAILTTIDGVSDEKADVSDSDPLCARIRWQCSYAELQADWATGLLDADALQQQLAAWAETAWPEADPLIHYQWALVALQAGAYGQAREQLQFSDTALTASAQPNAAMQAAIGWLSALIALHDPEAPLGAALEDASEVLATMPWVDSPNALWLLPIHRHLVLSELFLAQLHALQTIPLTANHATAFQQLLDTLDADPQVLADLAPESGPQRALYRAYAQFYRVTQASYRDDTAVQAAFEQAAASTDPTLAALVMLNQAFLISQRPDHAYQLGNRAIEQLHVSDPTMPLALADLLPAGYQLEAQCDSDDDSDDEDQSDAEWWLLAPEPSQRNLVLDPNWLRRCPLPIPANSLMVAFNPLLQPTLSEAPSVDTDVWAHSLAALATWCLTPDSDPSLTLDTIWQAMLSLDENPTTQALAVAMVTLLDQLEHYALDSPQLHATVQPAIEAVIDAYQCALAAHEHSEHDSDDTEPPSHLPPAPGC